MATRGTNNSSRNWVCFCGSKLVVNKNEELKDKEDNNGIVAKVWGDNSKRPTITCFACTRVVEDSYKNEAGTTTTQGHQEANREQT